MSVIPLKADIDQRGLDVRLVPLADLQITTDNGEGTSPRSWPLLRRTEPAFRFALDDLVEPD